MVETRSRDHNTLHSLVSAFSVVTEKQFRCTLIILAVVAIIVIIMMIVVFFFNIFIHFP